MSSSTSVLLSKPAAECQKKAPQRSWWHRAWSVLLLLNLIPVGAIWLDLVGFRPLHQTLPQIITLVVILLGWLYAKPQFDNEERQSSWLGLVCLVVVSALFALSAMFNLNRPFMFLAVPLVASFVWSAEGTKRLRSVLPLFFLALFLLPDLQEQMRAAFSLPLQLLCTTITGSVCKLFFPITYSGHYFWINGTTYDVAPGCSGLNMLATFLFAFAILQTFERTRLLGYFVVLALDPIITLVLNSIRIILTATAGYTISPAFAISIHSNLEFVLVPLGLIWIFMFSKRFREAKAELSV